MRDTTELLESPPTGRYRTIAAKMALQALPTEIWRNRPDLIEFVIEAITSAAEQAILRSAAPTVGIQLKYATIKKRS